MRSDTIIAYVHISKVQSREMNVQKQKWLLLKLKLIWLYKIHRDELYSATKQP